jgi:hypothetical protein
MNATATNFYGKRYTDGPHGLIYPLNCIRTGVPLGTLNLTISGGHVPYLSHWNEQICYHPYFSMEQGKLISMIRDEWNRLAKAITDEHITDNEATNLRVGFVAVLHSLGSIKQDRGIIAIPTLGTVQSNLESLIALAYWQNYLDSKRFAFPFLHISKLNDNADLASIGDYLDDCWDKKKEYESGMSEVQEKEKARIAEKAILAIRNTFLKPPSKKLLWQWVRANLPAKWQPDAEGWLGTIFLGNIASSLEFELDEIDLMEEIIVSSCPVGNSVMYAVRERIEEIRKGYKEHYDTFVIEETGLEFIEGIKTEHQKSPEPKEKDFTSRAQFFVARAKWQLANPIPQSPRILKEIESAKAKLSYRSDEL